MNIDTSQQQYPYNLNITKKSGILGFFTTFF